MSRGTVNLQDIADRLGMSIATVSKALGHRPDVSSVTRAKVAQLAAELGYRPKRQSPRDGQPPAGRNGRLIGVLVRMDDAAMLNRHHSPLASMSQKALSLNASLMVHIVSLSDPEEVILEPAGQPAAMRDGSLAGLILHGSWSQRIAEALALLHPCVRVSFSSQRGTIDVVGVDNLSAMDEVVEQLFTLGHRRIGFFGCCADLDWATERFAGYAHALTALQMRLDPSLIIDIPPLPLVSEGHDDVWTGVIDRVADLSTKGVTAWVCSSNWPGYQLWRGLSERGLNVPDDVSITGFDDTEPVTLGCGPLTSVQLPRDDMVNAAVDRLAHLIDHPDSPKRKLLFGCRIVDHGTTSPPRTATPNNGSKRGRRAVSRAG